MPRPHLSRRALLVIGAGGGAGMTLSAITLGPWQSRLAEAQIDPSLPVTDLPPSQSGPTLDGTDPALLGTDPALATDAALTAPATPVVMPDVSVPSPTWIPTDAGMATSLGGADIAVASEGGSHQVDAPKRKANKILGETKRP